MNKPVISIIIVNYNTINFLFRCIHSIIQHTKAIKYEIIVIDNASYDGSDKLIKDNFKDVKYIQNPINTGFAIANNLGASVSSGQFLVFLNPDTLLKDNCISKFVDIFLKFPKIGVIGANLLNSDYSFQESSIQNFPNYFNQLCSIDFLKLQYPNSTLWGYEKYKTQLSPNLSFVQAVSGACLVVKKDIFKKINGFSMDYFMYAEDVDLCFKVRQLDLDVVYCHDAHIIHFGGGSSKNSTSKFSTVLMRESIYRFIYNYRGCFHAFLYRISMTIISLIRGLFILMIAWPIFFIKNGKGRKKVIKVTKKWYLIFKWSICLESWAQELNTKTQKNSLSYKSILRY